jgi:hypothetical protein
MINQKQINDKNTTSTKKLKKKKRIKIEKRSDYGWASPPKCSTHLTPLSVYLSCVFSESPVAPRVREKARSNKGGNKKQRPLQITFYQNYS